ncbi:MAG: hypothetical protein HQ515_11745, partial [Phycisphaeraceae bacterium]|nr:hypothetical protein [Phycisphaeraceae bacterium]
MTDTPLKPAIVLVADRTLMGRYKVLFEGIFATMQTTQVPEAALRHFLSPKIRTDAQGRAHSTPLGLRRVESALLVETELSPDDVVCTTPEKVLSMIGPWTRAVIFSSSDPLGRGMSNTTTTHFWKGELYTKHWTRELLESLIPHKDKYGFKVVAGGAGAWQWHSFPDLAKGLPVDVVFEGYFESQGPQLIKDLLAGRPVESRIQEKSTCVNHIQPIRGASVLGILELSRGCGRGCRFCAMGRTRMDHLPVDTILADLQTNVSAGMKSVVSGSEDFFRYGADSIHPNFDALHHLLTEMRTIKGLSFMQMDHGNVA